MTNFQWRGFTALAAGVCVVRNAWQGDDTSAVAIASFATALLVTQAGLQFILARVARL